ncbi:MULTISPECIES: rhodanese-like domain-containing protein [unclassified Sphingopyxis]|uniref:rhodanese-like domain-containing protein n=1 Tax=unclassified Sphingopyxis TaxID=2614943 RepID=UPI002860CAE0|nr:MULTISPECIES: rhodanese-like domain-containing protein [unclassified Sphingopyxis]MDR7061716.1 rhodanese-related sulfurtransferase [Sphingopyxis sp. BE235]MDR7182339.1 rhodanese-related sulfurtransferase [Sphingopyxis sp. BE249]
MRTLLLALALTAATPALAQANPQIDYPAFQALTASVAPARTTRLIAFDAFKAEAAKPGTLLLDARSKDAFARGHIKGAVNLPLTDFTAESLAAVIGASPDRPILIYCNNNFSNHRSPVPLKSAALALNIQTFINLVGYGYPNVRELADVVDFTDPKVEWVTG